MCCLITHDLRLLGAVFSAQGYEIRIVGGAVRDYHLGVVASDIDLCTDATPDQIATVCRSQQWTVIETGLQHGTLTVVINGNRYEITTLRVDVETDGRHAQVEFTTSFEIDAARRDLTINALSMDLSGHTYDYFSGLEDLRNKQIRFVGDAEQRIAEDYLRVLRFFRFAARFDAEMNRETLEIFKQPWVSAGLQTISAERIWSELRLILVAVGKMRTILAMNATGISRVIGLTGFVNLPLLERADDAVSALVAVSSPGSRLEEKLKFSTEESKKLLWLWNMQAFAHSIKVEFVENLLVEGISRNWVTSFCKLYAATECVAAAETFAVPDFPITGEDLIDRGYLQGPKLGQTLRALKQSWMRSRFRLSKDQLLKNIR